MTRQMVGFLARIARGLGREADWGRMRFVALCVGSAAMALAAVIPTFMLGLATDREQAMRSLLPVMAKDGQAAAVLYSYHLPFLRDSDNILQPTVAIWISPLTDDAPLPPGVRAWPGPGEVLVSPAARRDLASYPADFFGHVVGSIASEGLEVPGERRIYVRPTERAVDPDEMTPIIGFGGPNGSEGFWGPPTLYARPLSSLLLVVGLLLIAPAVVAIAIGAGVGAEARQRRSRQLVAMGAGRNHLAIVDVFEAWTAVATGSLLGLGALLGLGLFDIDLRFLDSTLHAGDMRALWWQGIAAIVVAHLVALMIVLGVRVRQQTRRRARKAKSLQTTPQLRALVCIAAAILAVWLPVMFRTWVWRVLSYEAAVLIVILTLPALVAALLVAFGQLAAAAGRRGGSPGAIVAGRRLAAYPTRTARLISGVAGAILILGQVQLFASTLGEIYQQGVKDRATFGNVVLTGHFHNSAGVQAWLRSLPRDVEPVWTWLIFAEGTGDTQTSKNQEFLTGSCAALRALDYPCHSGESRTRRSANRMLTALSSAAGLSSGNLTIKPDEAPDLRQLTQIEAQISLISTTGSDMQVDQIRKVANQSSVGGMDLEAIGERAIAGGTTSLYAQRWMIFWGLLGLLPLTLTTAIVLAADALISARETAPLAALSDRRKWLTVVSLGGIWLPLTLAGVLAGLGYLILPSSMTSTSGGVMFLSPSLTYAWASALLCTLVGLALSYWNQRATVLAAETWRPG